MQRWTRAVRWPVATCNRIDAHAARAYHVLLCHHSRSFWCCEHGWPGCHAVLFAQRMKQAASTAPPLRMRKRPRCSHLGLRVVNVSRQYTAWGVVNRVMSVGQLAPECADARPLL